MKYIYVVLIMIVLVGGYFIFRPHKIEPTPKVIYCIGDSLTYGVGSGGKSYPDFLQEMMPDYKVVNLGVSGNTTEQMLARIPSDRGYYVIWGGINDIYRDIPLEVTKSNLLKMYQGRKAVFLNITPSRGDKGWAPDKQIRTDELNKWISQYNFVNVHDLVEDPLKPDYLLPLYSADGLHLQQDGYTVVANAISHNLW